MQYPDCLRDCKQKRLIQSEWLTERRNADANYWWRLRRTDPALYSDNRASQTSTW